MKNQGVIGLKDGAGGTFKYYFLRLETIYRAENINIVSSNVNVQTQHRPN
jgi:hypothetical protein